MTLRDVLNREISEKDFTQQIVDLCRLEGVPCYHTYDARRSREGFPDLVLVPDVVIFAELKRETGELTDAQVRWLDALDQASAGKPRVFVWRPRHWLWIERIVREGLRPRIRYADWEADAGVWPIGEHVRV